MKLETLEDLFLSQLRELLDEERQLVDALPKMARNASSGRLREAFEEHLEQTREHVDRLRECFHELGEHPQEQTAAGMKGLIAEGQKMASEIEQSPLRDAALIGAGRRVEHYEIAAYSSVIAFARLLGHQGIVQRLEATLREEQETDTRLSRVGEGLVNQEALQLGAHMEV